MIKKIIGVCLFASILAVGASAYDAEKAKKFDQFYSNYTPKALASSKVNISASDTMQMIRENKKFTFLDIRTRAEMDILGVTAPNTLQIELQDLFKEKSLKSLPTDELILIVCHSGSRATMAATSLTMLGFTNVHVLKGGIKSFANEVGTKTVPLK